MSYPGPSIWQTLIVPLNHRYCFLLWEVALIIKSTLDNRTMSAAKHHLQISLIKPNFYLVAQSQRRHSSNLMYSKRKNQTPSSIHIVVICYSSSSRLKMAMAMAQRKRHGLRDIYLPIRKISPAASYFTYLEPTHYVKC